MDTRIKKVKRDRRKKRIRAKIFGTTLKPRLSVFRSNRYISAQLINDELGVTIAAATSKDGKAKTVLERAKEVGQKIAAQALAKKVTEAVFDRAGYLYTGSVAGVANGARDAGLKL